MIRIKKPGVGSDRITPVTRIGKIRELDKQSTLSKIQKIFSDLGLDKPEILDIPVESAGILHAPVLLLLKANYDPEKLEIYGQVMERIMDEVYPSVGMQFKGKELFIVLMDKKEAGSASEILSQITQLN